MGASRCNGFTLVEALVALAILAVALAAAARAVELATASAAEVKLRVLAGFVAENRLSELAARRAWPSPGVSEGADGQAGLHFPWKVEVLSTPHPDLRRVNVHVLDPRDRSHELRRLVGVLAREN